MNNAALDTAWLHVYCMFFHSADRENIKYFHDNFVQVLNFGHFVCLN